MTHWSYSAACRGDLRFTSAPEAVQRATCARCPVTTQCLQYALDYEHAHHSSRLDELPIYGGYSGPERGQIRNRGDKTTTPHTTWARSPCPTCGGASVDADYAEMWQLATVEHRCAAGHRWEVRWTLPRKAAAA